ncbi:hypothetical protein B0H10DRAFT_2321911 [Mycena sp. CBHHK59/15]|nr:hypothetical protein B0H10DRAFT_2321911 [Mycena sp. CBHHK59/15]
MDCRWIFKAAVIEGNKYHIWSDSWHRGWWCSPSPSRIPEVWAEYKSICSVPAQITEKRRLMEIRGMVLAGQEEGETFGDEEMNKCKKSDPELWWKPLDDLRCPGCGKAGTPVGGASFRIPKFRIYAILPRLSMYKPGHV